MEQRLLYTQTANAPMITEFLASNGVGLVDNKGHNSDWIEIYNPQVSNFDLSGYYLTDNAGDLTGWQFPAGTIMTGGSYIVVFASGDDDAVVGQPFHTDFQITDAAGYLGLVAPDGVTVLSDYDYPEQVTDTSYGIATNSTLTTFINSNGALVKTFVPTSSIGGGWKGTFFDDSSWAQGTTGVGYEADPPPPPFAGMTVRMVDINGGTDGSIDNITEAQGILNGTSNPAAHTKVFDGSKEYTNVNFGGGQSFIGDSILPNGETNQDALGRTNYALRVTAQVVIPVGQWTIDIGSDEGFRLRIPGIKFSLASKTGQEFTSITLPQSQTDINETLVYGGARVFGHTSGAFTVVGEPLVTTIQLDYFERSAADALEMSSAIGQKAFNTTDFALLRDGWNGWQFSTPVTTPPNNYAPLIKTDLKESMYNGNTTAYMRLPFDVLDPTQFDTLKLRMKYDDGFVAYLNGVKIADRNAPDSPVWDSAATGEHPDAAAMVFEDFDLPIPEGVLQEGTNVLAIQGLNDASDSPDFLIIPSLSGVQNIILQGDRYMNPTPGALNTTSTINGVVADTKFSHDHGFYDTAFNLTITTDTVGAQIRYTMNGSAPTFNTGTVYSGPIAINKTTTLRVAAFKSGLTSSDVDTQTFIFLNDVILQSPTGQAPVTGGTTWPSGSVNGQILDYGMDPDIVNNATWGPLIKDALKALPTINIAVDLNDMFGAATGIFTHPRSDGAAWERPASLELINPDGSEGFQINAGIRIRGGFSRDPANPKHGFRFFFRENYGAPKLKYKLFGDDPTATDEFDKIDFRTFQNYSWSYQGDANGTFVRDIMGRDLQLAAGDVSSHGKDYNLYINGQYWGIYQTDERPEANFAESYYGEVPDGYDTVKVETNASYTIEATDGDLNAWRQLWETSRIPSTAQVDIFTPINVEIGDVFTLTVTGKKGATASVSYTAQAATVADVTAGLVAAWNASTSPLIATVAAQSISGTVKLTGKLIGMPITVSSSSTNGGADGAQALQRQTIVTPAFIETGDTFIITARTADGSRNISVAYTATAPSIANVTAGLAAAWNAAGAAVGADPLIAALTAVDNSTNIILIAKDSNVPFYLTSSAANGTGVNSQLLTQTAAFIGAPPVNSYQKVQGNNPDGTRNPNYPNLVDVDNLIDYILLTYWGGNLDAPISNFLGNASPNNFFCTRPRDGSRGFSCVEHDSEHTLLPWYTTNTDAFGNRLGPSPGNGWSAGNTFDKSNPQYIFQQLWNNQEFQLRVADKVRSMFFDGGILTPAAVTALINKRKAELDLAVVAESARWGDAKVGTPYTKNTWLTAFNNMMNNFVNASPVTRTQLVFNQLVNWNLYTKLPNGTVFNAPVYSKYGGDIDNGFTLTMTNPNAVGGTIFYTTDGSDPRMYGAEVSPIASTYSAPLPLNTSTTVNARIRYQTGNTVVWSALSSYKFKYNLAALHVSELNYNPEPPPQGSPYTADDFEFIELQNTGNKPLPLGGVHFDEGITFTFPTMTLAAGARTLVVKNQAAFESRYGLGLPIAGEYTGVLGGTFSNLSEDVNILGPLNEQLLHFNYNHDWYPITDGAGYTLVVRDPNAGQLPTVPDPTNPLSHSINWRPSNLSGGGPGIADPGINPESVVINEAMSNSTAPSGDWIELKNLTNTAMDISGWYLSDSAADLKKYQIPANTILQPNAYMVFYAQSSFGNAGNPGVTTAFTLDEVVAADIYLTNNDGAGNVAGYREHADFGASVPDVSFGRYIKSTLATDRTDFTQLVSATPGANNSAPTVGPIVISEINYNPTAGGSEFLEIENITDFPVQLWDPANPNNTWKFLSGISLTFPTNTTVPGFGSIVLIPQTISIALFRSSYNVPPEVQVFQYGGALDNGGEDIKLARPLPPVTTPTGPVVPYVLADKLKYGDSLPWPTTPDGGGPSLQRAQPVNYGNDPSNWKAGPFNGNPGVVQAPQRPPVVDVGADATVVQGVAFLRTGSFSDVNNEQTWTGTVNWGDGTPVQNLTLNANKTFNLNHTYLSVGTFTVTVTVTDSYPESSSDTLSVNVTPSNPPVVSAGADANLVQGDTFSQGGSFTDVDAGQSWSATVNWGDTPTNFPLTLNLDKTFNLNHVYPNVGNYTVTVTVKDNANVIGTDMLQVTTVANTVPGVSSGPDQTLAQGGTFSASGSFTDPNTQQSWTGTINWGDGTATAPLTLNANKTFNLSHVYANPGTFTATITVTDNVGGGGVDTVIVSVTPSARLGGSGDDTYIIRIDPTNPAMMQFFENRTIAQGPSYAVAYSAMSNYTFNGVGGNDSFVIDTTFGNPIPVGGVNFNGGAQTFDGADLIQVIGGDANDSVIIRSTQVQVGSSNITYGSAEMIRFDGNGGDDTLTINNSLNFVPIYNAGSGNNTLVLNAGEMDYFEDLAVSSSNLSVIANNSAIFGFVANQHLASLTLNDTSTAVLAESFGITLFTGGLTVGPQAILDVNDNDLVLQATAANRVAMLAMVNDLLHSGRNGGTWNGPGIDSSIAANNATHNTGVAAIINDQGNGTVVRQTMGGETLNNNQILLKYTYNGDANEDGTLNADDYALIDAGFASHSTGYYNGDFNFSGGAPNADDYFLIDKAFAGQGAPLAAPVAPAAAETIAPQAVSTTASGSKAAVKAPGGQSTKKKKHQRHHKRSVIDALEIEPRMILQRRRD
ncbi:MAG TPA: lamin tail domain-containing protein [Tepidisphaeraceae bacterium]|nr:lamin tail domain-containing protein [Tepidisphaeraceae bacterium]